MHRRGLRLTRSAGTSRPAVYTVVFFLVAPGTTAGLVPWLLTGWDLPDDGSVAITAAAAALVLAGASVVVTCFVRFVTEGRGTPAPVAPTRTLVVGGPYRYVRNPMYVGVASAIAGQALLFRSWPVLVWLAVFLAAVASFVKTFEEPRLAEQFGADYDRYRGAVPGWWPRLTPYAD